MSKLIKISIIVIPVFLFGLFIGIITPNASISDLIYNEKYVERYSQNLTPINIDEYVVHKDKNEIKLPRKAFELLFLLASKPERVFKREEIMNHVWGTQVVVGDRTIDVHIRKLREKIGEKHIRTIKGVGYKFKS